ncbi:MAG: class I SAM-dependent methyltransferase [Phycisphaerae bacterium]|nr:class I SAM-dependent methyltransferase [Phycisphaerae bacterium]
MAADSLAHWTSVWTSKRPEETSWFEERSDESLRAVERLGIGPDATVLDVGGGASRFVDGLLERGHTNVAVLDVAAPALDAAKARLGARASVVRWIVGDALEPSTLSALAGTVDVWHDRAMFHFLTDEPAIARYRAALDRALAPTGRVILATFAPDGPEKCSNLPVSRHDAASAERALGPGFRVVESWRTIHRTPWGSEQRFAWSILARS